MSWLLVLLSLLLGGSAVAGPDPGPPSEPDPGSAVATLVGSWSEADAGLAGRRVEPAVLSTDAERDAFVAAAPPGVRRSVGELVARVDLRAEVLVVGGYADCLDHSEVVLGPDGPAFGVVDDEPGAACEWSPYTVDAHAAPR